MKKITLHLSTFAFVLLTGCWTPNQTNNPSVQAASSINEVCGYCIRQFNENASFKIVNDLNTVHKYRKMIPSELRALYPEARDAWNSALRNIENAYSDYGIETGLAAYNGAYENWKETEMENYQKFYFYLTEYRYGPYPTETKDNFKKSAWKENADIRLRMNALIKRFNEDCKNVSSEKIIPLLKGNRLPDTIDECIAQ